MSGGSWCVLPPWWSHVRQLGATAIVGTRYDGSEVQGGSTATTEVLCDGTAGVVERLENAGQGFHS